MFGSAVNVIDVFVILVILISGLVAFFRGCVHVLLSVGSWVGAGIATIHAFPHVEPYFHEIIAVPFLAQIAAGAVIFVGVLVILSILTRALARQVQESSLGALDRSLGLGLGLALGYALVCAAWIGFSWYVPKEDWPETIVNAKTRPLVQIGSATIMGAVPSPWLERSGTADEEARRLAEEAREATEAYQRLRSPILKGDAPESEARYNDDMRDALMRIIEDHSQDAAQSGEQQ